MSNGELELVLFDLDGTLYFSTAILPNAYERGIREFNETHEAEVTIPERDQVLDQNGKTLDEIHQDLFSVLNPDQWETLVGHILDELVELIRADGGELADGVFTVLENMGNRYPLGLVTNSQTKYMRAVVETYGLDRYFDRLKCIEMVDTQKKATLVQDMVDHFDVSYDRTVLIGDRGSDFEAARETGTEFIACKYGYSSASELPCENAIDSLRELSEHSYFNLSPIE